MKKNKILTFKSLLLAFIALLYSVQSMFGQDSLISLKFTVKNIALRTFCCCNWNSYPISEKISNVY